jgi:hypothetical protein
MSNLIIEPFTRLNLIKTLEQLGVEGTKDYGFPFSAVIVLTWSFIFMLLSYKLLKEEICNSIFLLVLLIENINNCIITYNLQYINHFADRNGLYQKIYSSHEEILIQINFNNSRDH